MQLFEKDIFDQLKKEHSEVQSLFEQCERASPADRMELLHKIENELIPHARAEEKTLYATLYESRSEDSKESKKINEAYEEHAAVDRLISDLRDLSVDDETWIAKLTVIKENVNHHIEEEEKELFKIAKKSLDGEQLDSLHDRYNEQKKRFADTLPTQAQIAAKKPA